jgi:methylenetetrahydrofolate reductase (NADPH)
MKLIRDIHAACRAEGRPAVSFEFFPPKTPEGEVTLMETTLPALMAFGPDYASVTYGAGGGTREKTIEIVDRMQREHGLTTMMHLTCVNSTRAELVAILDEARARGIKNILALRGDPPGGSGPWTATEGGFTYSKELVALIRDMGGFSIGTAGFPEGHIACAEGREVDWERLKQKVDCGADFVVTQLFFDNEDFFRFRDHLVHQLGCHVPLIPGLLPILSAGQTKKFVALCGAALPERFLARLDALGHDDESVVQFGIDYATEQCSALLAGGVTGIHFYTLNKARSTVEIVRNLGISRSFA